MGAESMPFSFNRIRRAKYPGPVRETIVRLLRASKTSTGMRMIRFTMVSMITTVITFTILFLVYGVFRVWSEVPSALFANACGVLPSYNLNRRWTWGKTGRSHLRAR